MTFFVSGVVETHYKNQDYNFYLYPYLYPATTLDP